MDVIRVAYRNISHRIYDLMLRGVARYGKPPRNWLITLGENSPEYLQTGGFSGFIGSVGGVSGLERLLPLRFPVVNLLGHEVVDRVPSVVVDDRAVGEMAAAHFRDRAYKHYGFVGNMAQIAYGMRYLAFRTGIGGIAQTFSHCSVIYNETPSDFDEMLRWLRGLPKPVAVFAADDHIGMAVTATCQLGGLNVPEEVAVLGVNNEDIPCEASSPALSSVVIPWERIGHEGAVLLNTLIEGRKPPEPVQNVPPTGIVTRGSSEITAIDDSEVAQVVGYIRTHSHEPITVKQILASFPVSRRSLEQRFKTVLGRTLLEEIHRVRIERAKEQLVNSRLRVRDIARENGFSSALHLHRAFQSRVGMSPAAYRERYSANY